MNAGRQFSGAPALVRHQRGEERNVVTDAVNDEGIERVGLRVDCRLARRRVGDQLGDHRIVVERNLAAFVDAGIVAHRDAIRHALGRRAVARQPPGRGHEIAVRVLGIDAALHRPAIELHVALLDRQLFAGGDTDHLLDQIDAGDEFGHRMLDLQPRVHLEEEEALVLAGDEFDRAGAVVTDGLGERDRLLAHGLARGGVEQRARRLLDHFLIAALDRAFALAEIDDVAVLVAQHLDFDVARLDDEFLDEDAVVAERGLRLRTGARKALRHFAIAVGDAHALAAAAGGGLDHHRIADVVGDLHRLDFVLDHAEMAGHGRDVCRGGRLLRLDLVAHRRDSLGIGADEDDAGGLQRLGKRLAFRQEAVAGMHRFRAALLAGGDDLLDHQIALGGFRRADVNGGVGHCHMQRVAVGIGIDGDRLDAHLARGLDDPAGDFAAIGDQDTLEHATSCDASSLPGKGCG